jgi:DNA (cytosine-5)-methyltransferase 1
MKSVELFAGAGGLAMGVGMAGFKPVVVAEWDKWACDTIRQNQARGFPLTADWPLHEGDVRSFDWSSIHGDIDLLAGGPPCQPFSMGGKHKAHDDARDMFPATVDIVRQLRPRAFIVENVKGLTRSSFASYFQYIQFQLEFPEVKRRPDETWFAHLSRLQAEHTSGALHVKGLAYNVIPTLVNAANFGVPQKRERVFIVGFRSDLGVDWSFPAESHSQAVLLRDQWVTGSYWDRHAVAKKDRPDPPHGLSLMLHRLTQDSLFQSAKPWRTIRDALVGLPDPESKAASLYNDHRFQGGARTYPGHTGSPLDAPSKTLKAGDHGVPGGENMLVKTDGEPRYLTLREAARVQTFPDGYVFHGSWSESMRQLGNAVPVALGNAVARSVAESLLMQKGAELSRMPTLRQAAA